MIAGDFNFPDPQSCLNYILATFGSPFDQDQREALEMMIRGYGCLTAIDQLNKLTSPIVREAANVR